MGQNGEHALRIDGKYEARRDAARRDESVRETGINLYFIANTERERDIECLRETARGAERGKERRRDIVNILAQKSIGIFLIFFFIKKYKRKS